MSDRYTKRRLQSSSLTTIISISLVLFMLGLVGLLLLNAKKLSDQVKENIVFELILEKDAKDADITRLAKTLDASEFVKSTEIISKEDAAKLLKDDLGEDFLAILDDNPLQPVVDVYLKAEYANPDSIKWIEPQLQKFKPVQEVFYHKTLLSSMNENMNKISFIILGFSALLLIIALALINNTIRLSIYSKRFLINTMQLVGATQGFIRRPFIWKGIRHGIFAACIAIGLLIGILYAIQRFMPDFAKLQDEQIILTLFVLVLVMGILISWISTFFAVRKYLRLKTEELYY